MTTIRTLGILTALSVVSTAALAQEPASPPAGATVQRIADDLKLSSSTVGTHLYNIKQKLDVVNQSELTLIAIRHGLITA